MANNTEGHIAQINISRGGVPKLPIAEAIVGSWGIEGDYHNDMQHHGGPERALCLYTLDEIERLQHDGHPIFPGSVGENITLAGIPQAALIPGTRMLLGENVEIELTTFAIPCKNITESFNDGNFTRISEKLHPGESRIYARVLRGGKIAVGQPVRILSAAADGNTASESSR